MTKTQLELALIVRDPEIQPRERMNHDIVTQYGEDMASGIAFPPVIVYHDGEHYWLADGFHRCGGAEAASLESIEAEIRKGTREDALWAASGANKEYDQVGLKRGNADKRRAVQMALGARPKMSGREIAKHVGVAPNTVEAERQLLSAQNEQIAIAEAKTREVIRNGKTYEMDVTNIGYIVPEPEPVSSSSIKAEIKPASKPVFNETNDMVDWARWTWNPVTGCEHTCFYCYARDIANRFYAEKFAPTFRPERLEAPRNTRFPDGSKGSTWQNVFVCSMADLFGRWVPDEWIESVFESCRQSPEWNYLFLTKFPQRYVGLDFPATSWVGTTVDEQKRVVNAEKAFRKIDVPFKWLSVEPMLEPLKFTDLSMFDWVVIGGQSRSSGGPEFFPDPRWVHDLTRQAIDAGCKVYQKENISRTIGMFKELPLARERPSNA